MTVGEPCTLCGTRPATPKSAQSDQGSWCDDCRRAYWKGYDAGRRGRVSIPGWTRRRSPAPN
jgi:hypothetical protein